MTDTPRRYKEENELTGDELLQVVQARRRQEDPPKFERSEYREYKAQALREAGLDDEADQLEAEATGPVPLEERTTEEHLDRLQAGRR